MIRLKSQTEAVIDVLACRCSELPPGDEYQVGTLEPAPADDAAAIRAETRRLQRERRAERKRQALECFEQYRDTAPLMAAMIRSACLAGDDTGGFKMAAALLDAVVRTRYAAMMGGRYGHHSLTYCIAKLAGSRHISEESAVALIDAAQVVARVQAAKEKHRWYGEHAAYVATVAGRFAEGVEPPVARTRRRWVVRSKHAAAVAVEAYRAEMAHSDDSMGADQ